MTEISFEYFVLAFVICLLFESKYVLASFIVFPKFEVELSTRISELFAKLICGGKAMIAILFGS